MKLIEYSPSGYRFDREIARDMFIEQKARELNNAGYLFEAELCLDGEVHLECIRPENTVDDELRDFPIILGIQLGICNEMLPLVLDRLVESSYNNYRQNYQNLGKELDTTT